MKTRSASLDNRIEIVTPENIAFQYRVAGPFWRLPAYLIDVAIRAAVMIVAVAAVTMLSAISLSGAFLGLLPVLWFALTWFYGGVFETIWNGQTPGKRAMRLRVVRTDGQPIDALQAVLRNVLRAVDSMPMMFWIPTYILGLFSCAATSRYQRLGDLACGTMVVIEEQERLYGVQPVHDAGVKDLASQLPTDLVVPRSLARALAKYVERRQRFSPQRRAEIASHLGRPLKERFDLPVQTSDDLLLCALYYRQFVSQRVDDDAYQPVGGSPFAAIPTEAATTSAATTGTVS